MQRGIKYWTWSKGFWNLENGFYENIFVDKRNFLPFGHCGQTIFGVWSLLCPTFYGHICVVGNWRAANALNGSGTTGAAADQGHHSIILVLWSVWRPPTKVQRNISQFRTTIWSPVQWGEGGWATDSTTTVAAADDGRVYCIRPITTVTSGSAWLRLWRLNDIKITEQVKSWAL